MSACSALRATCLLLCLVAGSKQLSIKEFVVPGAVEVGEHAELRCQYDLLSNETDASLIVKWWWTPATASRDDRQQIYQHINGLSPEVIHHDRLEIKENDTIVLRDLTPKDSGAYECEVWKIAEIRKNSELVVYTKGTGPELNVSTVVTDSDGGGEQVFIECEASGVAPTPDLIVTDANGVEITLKETVSGPSSEGLYSIVANATLRKDAVEAGEVRCELLFANRNVTHPQYVDVENYDPAGGELTTAAPVEPAQPDSTPDPLLNSRDNSYQLHCSWALLAVALLTHLNLLPFKSFLLM